ncbi:uncharacterized protein BJX67DRAFT_167249 [Aspergillus lucknowensis]|uniref:Zn(2)-C6 fungal-type domain-containing protein n=1 Tax=Aspergillus lucknowensis TaxID=176173 RepID=A0ABR4M503_9EURO
MSAVISPAKRRACVACTAAKVKCTPQTADLCQRCARLGKPCTYLDLPQGKRKRGAAPSRVEVLEKKVDELMSQLAALTQQTGQISPNPSPDTSNSLPNDTHASCEREPDSANIAALLNAANDPSHGPDPPTGSVLAGQPSIVDRGLMSEIEAERLVATFQLELVSRFPFVVLAHGETAARLRDREPFLFLCIVAATMRCAHPLRETVAGEIMRHVTLRIVAGSERNLELLRGLLVHCAWYAYPAERHHPRLLLLIQLCVSILYDLGLHRRHDLTLDERRALLGTYFLSVGLCGSLGRLAITRRDARIDECIERIVSTEYPSDRWIAPLIHLQTFLGTMGEAYGSLQAGGGTALVNVTRGSLQRQFDILRASVERDLQGSPPATENAVRIELKNAEIRLEELSLREDLWTIDSAPASTARTTMLMGIIERSKELIYMIRNLPRCEIANMTITTSARICTAVIYIPTAVLALLNLITGSGSPPAQDPVHVQAIVDAADYPDLVTGLADVLEMRFEDMSVPSAAADKETDIVGSLCSKMRLLAQCYPYQIRAIVGTGHAASQDATATRLDTSTSTTTAAGVQVDGVSMTPLDVYGNLGDGFPVDDMEWDSLLSDFIGFSQYG